MLQPADRKVRPMEYRQAGAIAPVLVEPKPLFAVPDMDVRPLNGTKEDREQLKARVEELEQQLQQREQEFEQKLELARTAAFEDGRKAEASLRAAAVEKIAGQMATRLRSFVPHAMVTWRRWNRKWCNWRWPSQSECCGVKRRWIRFCWRVRCGWHSVRSLRRQRCV